MTDREKEIIEIMRENKEIARLLYEITVQCKKERTGERGIFSESILDDDKPSMDAYDVSSDASS